MQKFQNIIQIMEAISEMLESQRKPFQELLEKEFDKRGQFKFSLCSLTKFLVDDKPGDKEKDKKKNTRTDWLRNKQIIVYNLWCARVVKSLYFNTDFLYLKYRSSVFLYRFAVFKIQIFCIKIQLFNVQILKNAEFRL